MFGILGSTNSHEPKIIFKSQSKLDAWSFLEGIAIDYILNKLGDVSIYSTYLPLYKSPTSSNENAVFISPRNKQPKSKVFIKPGRNLGKLSIYKTTTKKGYLFNESSIKKLLVLQLIKLKESKHATYSESQELYDVYKDKELDKHFAQNILPLITYDPDEEFSNEIFSSESEESNSEDSSD